VLSWIIPSGSWKIPPTRRVEESRSFLILFILFVIAIEFAEKDRLIIAEIFFMIYSLGFTLEKVAAMQEHGIHGQYQFEFLLITVDLKFSVFFKGTWVRF